MTNVLASKARWEIVDTLLVLGIAAALSGAIAFLLFHVAALRSLQKSDAVASLIPNVETRLKTLERQSEATDLEAMLQSGTAADAFRAYVVPVSPDRERLLGFIETVTQTLRKQGSLTHVLPVRIDSVDGGAASELDVQLAVDGTDDGIRTLLTLCEWSGLLTLGDVLSGSDTALLLQASEQENPVGIVALEQFLATDLLVYARGPAAAEAPVRKSFTSPAFTRIFDDILAHSALHDVHRILGGPVGRALEAARLWPVRFLTITHADLRVVGGSRHLELTLRAAGRAE